MVGVQMKFCKECFRMMKEEDLKNHVNTHKKNQIMYNRKKIQNMNGIFELEKEVDLKRMKNMKEKYMEDKIEKVNKLKFEKIINLSVYIRESVYIRKIGGCIRNMIDYSFKVVNKLFRIPIDFYKNM